MKGIKQGFTWLRRYLRWFIFGVTLWFIGRTFLSHWQEVAAIEIDRAGWGLLMTALGVTMLAHTWAAWVWGWMLRTLQLPITTRQAIPIYLLTNLAKYWPGNVGHFYLRIRAIAERGGSWGEATIGALLEPLLVVAMAVIVVIVCTGFGWISPIQVLSGWVIPVLGLAMVLIGIHPRVLNPLLQRLARKKLKEQKEQSDSVIATGLTHYPLAPLCGQLGFLVLRGLGFLLTWQALSRVSWWELGPQLPQLFSAFCVAWLLGMVVPGAPGGVGVFEATAIALLDVEQFPVGITLSTVAIFRVISILAEVLTAAAAWQIQSVKLR